MHTTIFKIAWPYLQRFLTKRAAEYVAGYLQTRREQRLMKHTDQEATEPSLSQESEVDSIEISISTPPASGFLSSDGFWFTMSGILLGTALSIIVAYIIKQDD